MIPGLPLSSLTITGGNQEQAGLSEAIYLKPGRIVDARVLDVQPENRVQLLLTGKPEIVSDPDVSVQNRAQQPEGRDSTSQVGSNVHSKPLAAGQKLEVSTPLPLKPGMSLTLTAVATRDGMVLKPVIPSTTSFSSNPLSSTGSDAVLKILPGKQNVSGLPDLGIKPGQTVEAKVNDVTPQNRVQLLVGGQKLTVSTQLSLARGMDIPMKVVQSQDGIVLKPVPGPPPSAATGTAGPGIDSAGKSAENTGRTLPSVSFSMQDSNLLSGTDKAAQSASTQSFSLAKIFQGLGALSQIQEPVLNDILMGLSLKSDLRDDQFLPKIIENMGLSFEKKLAAGFENAGDNKAFVHVMEQLADQDLKAAALSLSRTESDPAKASVLKHITDALDNLAQLNVKSGDGGQTQDGVRFLLPFPVWTENGFDFGQLMVDMGKTGTSNSGKKMLSISLLLNMTALGPLRADFSILDKSIAGRFLLENQASCDYLATKMSDLRQRLSGIGYQAGNIDCQVARPEQISPASLMLLMKAPDEMQGFNVVV